ncbi:MAG: acetyl-CoA carboxylase biotin carboxyl carrier protein [Pseudomonadota bacterium]
MSEDKYAADVTFIKALAEVLKDSDLTEIEVERKFSDDDKIEVKVSRQGTAVAFESVPMMPAAPAPVASPVPATAPAEATADPSQDPGAVTSPMVGTCYLQPEPGAPSFVKVGDQVSEGQTVIIIEAMKTMNQIPAPHAGTVKRILVDDGTPVEFGSPLMIIA